MKNRKIIIYIMIAYGITWLLWLPLLMNKVRDINIPLLPYQFYLASFGPLIAAAVTSLITGGKKEIKSWIKRTYSIRFPLKWLGIAILMPILYGIASVIIHRLMVGAWPDWSRFGLTEKLPGLNILQTAFVWVATFGIGEESGWRGFLLPELNKRYSLRISALIVALVWIFWHLPAFFFNENYINMGPGILGWAISLSFGSILLAWLCSESRFSVIPVLIWHGGFDLITASDEAAQVMAMVCSMLVIIQGIYLVRKMARSELRKE